jgi:hypothetical protein
VAGINRALYEHRHIAKINATFDEPCSFLSHIFIDKAAAIAIADYINARGDIDTYLDINDDDLQLAARTGDSVAVTKFIEQGLSKSTHILCLVSPNTVRSWWVPYELGFAKKSEMPLATLKLKDTDLPAYLEISEIIKGTESLNRYLTGVKRGLRKSVTAGALTKSLLPGYTQPHPLDPYLDWKA